LPFDASQVHCCIRPNLQQHWIQLLLLLLLLDQTLD
jgi:hypothetical protein